MKEEVCMKRFPLLLINLQVNKKHTNCQNYSNTLQKNSSIGNFIIKAANYDGHKVDLPFRVVSKVLL